MLQQYCENKLLSICCEFLLYGAKLEDKDKISQNEIKEMLGQVKQKAVLENVNEKTINELVYGLCVYIDEKILKFDNEVTEYWKKNPLQLQYYQENIAGEGFFEKLAEFRQNLPQKIDLLEVYYYCIEFGLVGVYNVLGLKALKVLKNEIHEQILAIRGPERKLNPDNLQSEVRYFESKRLYILISCGIFILLIVYVGFYITIETQGNSFLNTVKTLLEAN
ncbi:MAG: type IVB secretion system protein IcmH/DotU [Gammaproteobacteria bacterium]